MGKWEDAAGSELRKLPAVHELAATLNAPHSLAVAAARRAIAERRSALIAGWGPDGSLEDRAIELLAELQRPSLTRVINATGVVLHTNLGRAPLPAAAREAVSMAAEGYANLELDLSHGDRGSRHAHVEALLEELTGAEAAIVVNNGAAAVLLAVAALAGPGRAVVVSRGQLIEIGGGFRIPDVVAQSGAALLEVGATNRTRLQDFQHAIAQAQIPIGAIMRVHQSNFRTLGFVEEVSIEALCGLDHPVIDDLGSGVLEDPSPLPILAAEPSLRRSLSAGASIVCCSGDKLLGGPQAGLMVGRADAIAAARAHPLARALRIDKLSLAALEASLRLHRDPERARREVPVLAMLDASEEQLVARAKRLQSEIGAASEIVRATGRVGGGALPLVELEGPAVALLADAPADAILSALRRSDPPVIARIHDQRVLLDPRTLDETDVQPAVTAVHDALDAVRFR